MNGHALILASMATLWFAIVIAAWLWIGFWISTTFPGEGPTLYWIFAWMAFAALAATPLIIYTEVDR